MPFLFEDQSPTFSHIKPNLASSIQVYIAHILHNVVYGNNGETTFLTYVVFLLLEASEEEHRPYNSAWDPAALEAEISRTDGYS
jgi:hypothetical protein